MESQTTKCRGMDMNVAMWAAFQNRHKKGRVRRVQGIKSLAKTMSR